MRNKLIPDAVKTVLIEKRSDSNNSNFPYSITILNEYAQQYIREINYIPEKVSEGINYTVFKFNIPMYARETLLIQKCELYENQLKNQI
jgi:hypothetical protein